jgi:hypothetical protein
MSKSGIYIKPSKRGSFTKAAKKGESTQAHASRVLSNPNSSKAMRKKAQFAKNAAKWHHRGSKRSSTR